jgi:hypothetical protein
MMNEGVIGCHGGVTSHSVQAVSLGYDGVDYGVDVLWITGIL